MNEKYLIVGLMVMAAILIIVIISLVAALKKSRVQIRQSQKNQYHSNIDKYNDGSIMKV